MTYHAALTRVWVSHIKNISCHKCPPWMTNRELREMVRNIVGVCIRACFSHISFLYIDCIVSLRLYSKLCSSELTIVATLSNQSRLAHITRPTTNLRETAFANWYFNDRDLRREDKLEKIIKTQTDTFMSSVCRRLQIHKRLCACRHEYTHTYIYTRALTHAYIHTYIYTLTHTRTHIRIYTHRYRHAYT